MKIRCEFHLLNLPNELIVLVLAQIDSPATLRSVACTSRRINALAEPLLYRSMVLRDRPGTERAVEAFGSRPDRAEALQILDVACRPRLGPEMSALEKVLVRAPNVRDLMFESPECSSGNFEPHDEWEELTDHLFIPLRMATSLGGLEPSQRPLQKLTKRAYASINDQ